MRYEITDYGLIGPIDGLNVISLIVATVNRLDELDRLMVSLDSQTYRDFEVIVVDQNPDERVVPLLQRHPGLSIRHLRSARGLSRARNTGLPFAKGKIIAFPDDDCWYPKDLLAIVNAWFDDHVEFDGLFSCLCDADNNPVGPRWPERGCLCTKQFILDRALSTCGFLRRQITDAIGAFDERMGLGADSQYQSGEETDYYLRPQKLGFRMWFEPSVRVHHPSLHSPDRLRRSTYSFARSSGYVMRAHGFTWWSLATRLTRSMGGALISLLKGDTGNVIIYLLRSAGLLRGYVLGPRDMARLSPRQD